MNGSATGRAVGLTLLVDVVAPIVVYYVLTAVGAGEPVALCVGGAVCGLRVLVTAARRRRFDAVAGLVVCVFGLELLALAVSGDPRVVLAADSIPTAALGLGFLASVVVGRAVAFSLLLGLLSGGDPAGEQFWRRAWTDGPTFRRALRVLTLGWGCLLLAEAVLRVVLLVALPFDVMVSVSRALQVALIAAMLGFAGWHGKRTGLGVRPYLDSIGVDASGGSR